MTAILGADKPKKCLSTKSVVGLNLPGLTSVSESQSIDRNQFYKYAWAT